MLDCHNRKVNYLRISVTDLCNLRCQYCMPAEGVVPFKHDEILSFEEIYEVAKAAVGLGVDKIRLTGGEPLVRKGIITLVKMLDSIDGIKDYAMTTNGILLKELA
ncbi:MAG: radical SAM protein, partial [Planctomycetota bacterium]